jgi:hypothetical protein
MSQDLALKGRKRAAFFEPQAYQDRVANLYAKLGVRPVPAAAMDAHVLSLQPTAP